MTIGNALKKGGQEGQPNEPLKSEIAQVLQQIEVEYQAATNGLSGYAQVASHRHRTQQTEQIKVHLDELISLVGEEEAIRLAAQALDQLDGGGSDAS